MKTFLEFVAEDIIKKHGTELSGIAVVFPNKRASLYLNGYLARLAGKPLWSPAYVTISDLYRQQSDLMVGDSVKLICELYKSFIKCTGIEETLDHFYGWGQLLLADFDDIDKNMADADQVFANLRNLHELDSVDYLSDEQKRILRKFFSNFTDDHETTLKRKFLELWSHFSEIYHDYRDRLRKQGLAYEGMLYREVTEKKQLSLQYDHYIFVGFNLLQKVEQKLVQSLKDEQKASFYWDFDHYYMKGTRDRLLPENEAGHFISAYLSRFPNELDSSDAVIYNHLNHDKQVTFISAQTENVQARYISQWLQEENRIADGRKTVIVMCDESILPTAVHCLPPSVEEMNVTTGYPLQHALISSLVKQVVNHHLYGGRRTYKQVMRHPYFSLLSASETPVVISQATPSTLNAHLLNVVRAVAMDDSHSQFEQEAIFRMYTLLNRLQNILTADQLEIDLVTYQKMLNQLIASTSIPFHGEPARGIQLMGVLETRNLDFDHVLILSCQEGNMPKGVNDSSFIPYSIRKAYGLTTIDHKVAVYAYYFHRLIQRAKDVTILYNNSTEDGHTGEMSRFMLQLMVESNLAIDRKTLQTGQEQTPLNPDPIEKAPAVVTKLRAIAQKGFYPTYINRYLRCQLQFYYNHIEGIREPDEMDEEKIDNRTFGNIFHKASEYLYTKMRRSDLMVLPEDIEFMQKNPQEIEMAVDKAFKEEVFDKRQTPAGAQNDLNGLQLINREVVIHYLKRLLRIDKQLAPFQVIGLEEKVDGIMDIDTSVGKITVNMGGIIDRLDMVWDQEAGTHRIRVVDYKTGSRALTSKINTVEEIFEQPIVPQKHANYYLQTMLYSLFVQHDAKHNKNHLPVAPALLFIQHSGADDYDPILPMGKEKMKDISRYEEPFSKGIREVLTEIFEPSVPFKPTADRAICATCPYRQFCGL